MKIVFIAIDTLRADHLSCYGYQRPTSPNIDKLAQEGVLFSNAFAPGIPTTPAYTVMYTGLHPMTTGIITHAAPDKDQYLNPKIPVLPEILRGKGYTTAAVDNLYNIKNYFTRGYDYYMNPRYLQLITADTINEMAIPWIKQNKNKDFFLFLHYWDPHSPYLPPQRYRNLYYPGDPYDPDNHSMDPVKKQLVYPFYKVWHYDLLKNPTDINYLSAQYDSEINYVDEKIAEILYTLEEIGIVEDTLIILTSDHGENMTEHELYFGHTGVYETIIHIPLILRWPGKFPQGKKIKTMVQHTDYAPTILDILKVSSGKQMEGKSLLPLIEDKTQQGYQEIYTSECHWRAVRAVRTKEWKLIKAVDKGKIYEMPDRELYNLKTDPGETCNLAQEEREVADELDFKMQKWLEKKLGNRPDPLKIQALKGFPLTIWLERLLEEREGLSLDEWIKKQKYI